MYTPDRHDGPLYEEGIYFDTDTPAGATAAGEMRWTGSRFSFQDDNGEFDPAIGVSGFALGKSWAFSTTTTDADPGSGNFRLNNATQGSATQIYISYTAESGVDLSTVIQALRVGDRIYIQQNKDSTRSHLFRVTADVVDGTTYGKIPVASEDANTDLQNAERCGVEIFFVDRVAGPASVTDNQIARFDGVTGKKVQAGTTAPSYDDNGNIILANRDMSGVRVHIYNGLVSQTASVGGTTTVNWTTGIKQLVTFGAGNIGTLAFTAPGSGPCNLILLLRQDTTGSRTVGTWDSGIRWSGGTAPTLTTTASRVDLFAFVWTGTTLFSRYLGVMTPDFNMT